MLRQFVLVELIPPNLFLVATIRFDPAGAFDFDTTVTFAGDDSLFAEPLFVAHNKLLSAAKQ